MSTLFTFPGQGPQKAGMLKNLPKHAVIEQVLQEASDVLGYSVYNLDTEQALQLNRNVQVSMTVVAYASFRWLVSEGIVPNYVLGLSIGAFPAAICSGMISFEDGLKLVDLRGRLMSEAYPENYGMAAILGLPTQIVKHIVEQTCIESDPIYLANINTETQNILSGSWKGLDYACQLAIQMQAACARRLNVNVPSHCELLTNQADELFSAINQVEFKRPTMTYASASAARVLYDTDKIRHDLAYNMAKQVRWWETAAMMDQRGMKLAIELSPGAVLTSLCKGSMHGTQCVNMQTTSLDNMKILYQRAQR